jgi:hypothetical protein
MMVCCVTQAMVGFQLDGKMKLPHTEFDNEQVRYEHRFAPFASLLTPPPMQYAEFQDMTSLLRYEQPPSSTNLYLAGCQLFHKARSMLETINTPDQEVSAYIMSVESVSEIEASRILCPAGNTD